MPLAEPGGLGGLEGFDALVARCGLVGNGGPTSTTAVDCGTGSLAVSRTSRRTTST